MEENIDILLVDDEARNLDALEAILADPDYRLLRASSADEALRLLLQHSVAAIVMDVKMPGLSGFELAQLIKGSKRTRQIPILFLTAYLIDDHDALEGYGAGAVDYLTKPINPQILRRKVAVFADLFRKTRALAELNEKLEARVLERTAELEERERELRSVTDNTPDILMRFDRDLVRVWANPAAMRAIDSHALDVAMNGMWLQHLKHVFGTGEAMAIEFEEARCFYATSLVPEHRADGEVDHVLAVTHDVTAPRLADEALKETARQKDEFLATLAHELRNPLAPLRTGLDVLRKTDSSSPVFARTMVIMDRQLDHVVRLIDDLLDVSRISRGLLELKKQRSQLSTILENAVETCRPLVDLRKQTVEVEADPSIFAVVDPIRICQILANLLHNAAKYTPEGRVLKLSLAREGNTACMKVIDSGSGIAPDLIDRVFDMFAQVDRAHGGLGIGLSLARRLAVMHGGTLTAESKGKNKGSTFTLRLPAGSEDVAFASGNGESVHADVADALLEVLIIEDNVDAAEMLVVLLESMGHAVRVAHDGPAGLEMMGRQTPDIVLCDIGLPGMDGNEVCRRVRATIGGEVVMVALTGWGMEEDRQKTRAAGFDHHLVKPADFEVVREVLRAAASKRIAR